MAVIETNILRPKNNIDTHSKNGSILPLIFIHVAELHITVYSTCAGPTLPFIP